MCEEEKEVIEFLKMCGKSHIDSFTVKRKHINKIVSAINNLEKENEEQFRQICKLSIKLDMETISKDKIRDKIKEIEENEPYNTSFDIAQLATYRELLGEE